LNLLIFLLQFGSFSEVSDSRIFQVSRNTFQQKKQLFLIKRFNQAGIEMGTDELFHPGVQKKFRNPQDVEMGMPFFQTSDCLTLYDYAIQIQNHGDLRVTLQVSFQVFQGIEEGGGIIEFFQESAELPSVLRIGIDNRYPWLLHDFDPGDYQRPSSA
jgi:hypothetical protein